MAPCRLPFPLLSVISPNSFLRSIHIFAIILSSLTLHSCLLTSATQHPMELSHQHVVRLQPLCSRAYCRHESVATLPESTLRALWTPVDADDASLWIRSWKVAPALACGCTIVMKPSEITPLTALVRLGLCSSFPTCTIFCLSVTLVPFGCGLHFTRVSSESAKTLHTCRHFLLSFSVTRGYMQCRGCDWPDLSTYVSKWRRH